MILLVPADTEQCRPEIVGSSDYDLPDYFGSGQSQVCTRMLFGATTSWEPMGMISVPDARSLIESTRGICGGKARVAGTRIPVWGIENAHRLGLSISKIIERYPSLSREQVLAALDYADLHSAEIDRQIRDSQDAG